MELLSEKEAMEILKDFNNAKTFNKQIDVLKKNKKYVMVILDNDSQWIRFDCVIDSENEDWDFNNFEEIDYFGNADGVFRLFDYIGIKAENCNYYNNY